EGRDERLRGLLPSRGQNRPAEGGDGTQVHRKSAIVSVFVCWQALHWALLNGEVADRWQSGRMYLTRNQAYVQAYRGFESHPVRQFLLFISSLRQPGGDPRCR